MYLQTITLVVGWVGVYFYIKRKKIAPYLNLLNAISSMLIYYNAGIYGMLALMPFIFVNITLVAIKFHQNKQKQNLKLKTFLAGLLVGLATFFLNDLGTNGGIITILTTFLSSIALLSQIDNYKHTQKLWLLCSVLYTTHAYIYKLEITSIENFGYIILSIFGVFKEMEKK